MSWASKLTLYFFVIRSTLSLVVKRMTSLHGAPRGKAGFTLIELLVVMAIIALLTFILIPALAGLQKAGSFSKGVYDMSDAINFARSSAMGGNTFVYLGLTELDRTQSPGANPQLAGLGEVALAAVSTTDGTSDTTFSAASQTTSWTPPYSGANLTLLRPVQIFDFLYIAPQFQLPTATSGGMGRPSQGVDYLKVGSTLFPTATFPTTPFTVPLGPSSTGGKYNFTSAIPFSPQGSIVLNGTAAQWIEIDLQPYQGGAAPAAPTSATQGNQAALMIDGATGSITVYRP
jgi:prepilin-type N-terminal cleavage/methylation domain-containing protein